MPGAPGRARRARLSERLRPRSPRRATLPSSADELELIYRTAPIGLAMVDRDLRFVRVNERLAQINGASIADHLGRTIGEMVPAVSEQAEAVVRRVLETGVPWTDVEIVGETPARPGERRVWREHWYPVHGSAGAIVGVSVVVEDVTERLDAERALRGLADDLGDADRRKDEFLAMLAHELRNPLAPLRNAINVLSRTLPGGTPQHRAVEMSDRQVRRLTRLVDDLLDVSRITQGKIALHREPIAIADAVGEAADAVRPAIEARGLRLTVRLPERGPIVQADAVRLAQVFENLLSNASKYTDPGGEIEVAVDEVDADGGAVRVHVRDTGIGLPPDQLERVFELFTQVDGSRDRAQGGLGIGLSLVRQLVALHGGTVTASSDGIGRGACFVVTLPRARAEIAAA